MELIDIQLTVLPPISIQLTLIDSVNINLRTNQTVDLDVPIDPFLAQQIGELLTDTNYLLTYEISKL